MVNITSPRSVLQVKLWKVLASGIVLFFALFLSQKSLAQQTFPVCAKPNGSTFLPHCTSNDLTVLDAYLTGTCSCQPGQTATGTLNMRLFNKTGSGRASFAFFANLVQRNSAGQIVSTTYLTDCTTPVAPGSTSTITFSNPVSFVCGSTLTLTNVYLAWTDASENRQCPLAFCDIAPKFGTPADITITPLLTAVISTTQSCDNSPTGSITITPSGGVSPYDIVIKNASNVTVQSWTDVTGAQTKTGLAAGNYSITVTDAAAGTACVYNAPTTTVGSKSCCVNPPKPMVCEIPASLCPVGGGTVTLKVSNLQANAYYVVRQGTSPNFTYNQTQQATGGATTLTFTGLAPGLGFTAYGEDRVSTPFCKGPEATCGDLTTCAAGSITSRVINTSEDASLSEATVKAYPNPFSDNVKFVVTSPVAGKGNLEIYNMMGQKIKTVYQGFIAAGAQTFELSMPRQQISNLIYVLRIGDRKMSGKLLQINQ